MVSYIFLFILFLSIMTGILTQNALYALGVLIVGIIIKIIINLGKR